LFRRRAHLDGLRCGEVAGNYLNLR